MSNQREEGSAPMTCSVAVSEAMKFAESVRMAVAMSDEPEDERMFHESWATEAVQHIEKLLSMVDSLRLTEAERDAVESAVSAFDASECPENNRKADTIMVMLERLGW